MSLRSNGSYLGFTRTPTTSQGSASGIWSLAAAERQRRASAWPQPQPAFSPSDITGLSVWFDASDASTLYDATTGGSLVAADGTVKRWEDKSGNARHATEGTNPPQRKTAVVASQDALLFDGINDGMSFSGNMENGSGHVTLFVVAQRTSTSGVGFMLNKDNSNVSPRAHQFLRINGALVETHWWTPTLQAPTQGNITANVTFLASLRLGSSGGTVGLNGTDSALNSNGSSITTTNQPTQIGRYWTVNNADMWGGYICEIIGYDNALSNTDKEAVEDYLMAKWGIT